MISATAIGAIFSDGGVKTIAGYTIIVQDTYGNPVAVIQETADSIVSISTVMDDDFQRTLKALGVHKLVINERMPQKPPRPGASLLSEVN